MSEAFKIACDAHTGQFYGDEDYIEHIVRVRDKALTLIDYSDSDREIIGDLACLHDVLEDSDFTPEMVRERLGSDYQEIERLIDALQAITKQEGENRESYIIRCSENSLAWFVKVADTLSNLECSVISGETHRVFKYTKQINRLYAWKKNKGKS